MGADVQWLSGGHPSSPFNYCRHAVGERMRCRPRPISLRRSGARAASESRRRSSNESSQGSVPNQHRGATNIEEFVGYAIQWCLDVHSLQLLESSDAPARSISHPRPAKGRASTLTAARERQESKRLLSDSTLKNITNGLNGRRRREAMPFEQNFKWGVLRSRGASRDTHNNP
jgi:hypothetical protein